ncbi:MAG: GNAT family N-acetyltransferase [Lactobacillaceae bacterium]|jgi:RimJ/RimL family protein N-acetyltransferase|nr:GNAT family N-acetyltransferase [Lactobacillaceae bacterium]
MEIQTERLVLRKFNEKDVDRLFELAKNPNVADTAGWPAHQNKEESLNTIRTIFQEDGVFAISLKDNPDEIIGAISLKNSHEPHSKEIGYWVGEPYWNQGYATEALQAIINHAFGYLHLRTLIARYYDGNFGSQKVMEHNNFSFFKTVVDEPVLLLNTSKTIHYMKLESQSDAN